MLLMVSSGPQTNQLAVETVQARTLCSSAHSTVDDTKGVTSASHNLQRLRGLIARMAALTSRVLGACKCRDSSRATGMRWYHLSPYNMDTLGKLQTKLYPVHCACFYSLHVCVHCCTKQHIVRKKVDSHELARPKLKSVH